MQFFSLVPDFRTPVESKFTIFEQKIFFIGSKVHKKSFPRFSGKIFTVNESLEPKILIDVHFITFAPKIYWVPGVANDL